MFLQKQEKRATTFILNSYLLAPISSRANKETFCPKIHTAEKVEF